MRGRRSSTSTTPSSHGPPSARRTSSSTAMTSAASSTASTPTPAVPQRTLPPNQPAPLRRRPLPHFPPTIRSYWWPLWHPNRLRLNRVASASSHRSPFIAANLLRGLSASTAVSPSAAAVVLSSLLDPGVGADATSSHPHLSKILPFRRSRPLACSLETPPPPSDAAPAWRLAWLPPSRFRTVPLDAYGEGDGKEAAAYWAVDVSEGQRRGGWVDICGLENAHGGHELEQQGRHGGAHRCRTRLSAARMA